MSDNKNRRPLKDINKIFFGATLGLLVSLMVTQIPIDPSWQRVVILGLVMVSAFIYDKA